METLEASSFYLKGREAVLYRRTGAEQQGEREGDSCQLKLVQLAMRASHGLFCLSHAFSVHAVPAVHALTLGLSSTRKISTVRPHYQ